MRVVAPITVDNTALVSSSVAENDHAEWDVATTYAANDNVIVIGTAHSVYASVQGSNTGHDPATDDGTWWTRISATNRWKAFDSKIADKVTDTTAIEYEILTPSIVTAVALLGLSGPSVQIVVKNDSAVTVHDETIDLNDNSDVIDWFTYFYAATKTQTSVVHRGVPAFTGYTIEITIGESGSSAAVGQIVLGNDVELGQPLYGTQVGFEDFSIKTRDDFGNAILVERDYADEALFQFAVPSTDISRVKGVIASLRASPSVWFTGVSDDVYGTAVFGWPLDFSIPVQSKLSFATLEIEGLI